MDMEPLTAPEVRHPEPDTPGDPMEHWFRAFLQEVDLSNGDAPPTLRAWVDLAEAWRIIQALRDARGNRSAAARTLGIGRRTLYAKMERLGIEPSWSTRS